MTEPTIGRVVHYRLKKEDLQRLAERHPGAVLFPTADAPEHVRFQQGNTHYVGDVVPMLITRPWHQPGKYTPGTSLLNGTAVLDGPDLTLWVLSAAEGEEPGSWCWPPRA